MAKKKQTEREFSTVYGGRKPDFIVKTRLTDDEAINLLGGTDGNDFKAKCAFEIHKLKHGFRTHPTMVAWGFKMAEETVNPPAALKLLPSICDMVKCGRPLMGETFGFRFKVQRHGVRSKRPGQYTITDGEPYPGNLFYGRATKEGEWTPTRNTPQEIINKLTKE